MFSSLRFSSWECAKTRLQATLDFQSLSTRLHFPLHANHATCSAAPLLYLQTPTGLGPCGSRGPPAVPNPPYPSTQPARPARERVKRAFAASHQSEPSKRAVPVEHLRAQHARAISRVRGSRAPMRNPGLTTGESSAPETPGTSHS